MRSAGRSSYRYVIQEERFIGIVKPFGHNVISDPIYTLMIDRIFFWNQTLDTAMLTHGSGG